jgi:hypothetical protein
MGEDKFEITPELKEVYEVEKIRILKELEDIKQIISKKKEK